jgi:ribosome modulation factor
MMKADSWSLDALNKAYQQGFMVGLSGENNNECSFVDDILAAAWESGLEDGLEQYRLSIKKERYANSG